MARQELITQDLSQMLLQEVLAFVHYFKECVTAEDCDKHLKSISHNQIMVVAWILIKEHLYNDAIKSALW